ncbi:MAG: DUF2934 domain-containing protein [Pseudomonadota bacterium]
MDTSKTEMIRQRAYAIWESEGKPIGRDQEHWERASREIEAGGERDDSQGGAPEAVLSGELSGGIATEAARNPAAGGTTGARKAGAAGERPAAGSRAR